jgi:hypothetical protein
MKLLRNSPVVCAVSIFAVQRLTALDGNLRDDMGHYEPCLLELEGN